MINELAFTVLLLIIGAIWAALRRFYRAMKELDIFRKEDDFLMSGYCPPVSALCTKCGCGEFFQDGDFMFCVACGKPDEYEVQI